MKNMFSLWPKLAVFLALIPLAAFIGRGWTNGTLSAVLLVLLAVGSREMRETRRQLAKYLIPLAIGLLLLHFLLGTGNATVRFQDWLLSVSRFSVLLGFGLLFSVTTEPLDFPRAAKKLGIQDRYGMGLLVAYRLVPLLGDRIRTVMLSQRARGAVWRFTPRGLRQLPLLVTSLMVPSLYATLETSLALSDTLYIRGYRPGRTIAAAPVARRRPLLDALLLIAALGLLVVAASERLAT